MSLLSSTNYIRLPELINGAAADLQLLWNQTLIPVEGGRVEQRREEATASTFRLLPEGQS